MARKSRNFPIQILPEEVHATLREHMLVDGYPIVIDVERSHGDRLRDALTGKEYIDFFSFFASNPLGFNHPGMLEARFQAALAKTATTKFSNADFYSTALARFVKTLDETAAPQHLPHYFFVDGGALAVENAMKVAFDWKVQRSLRAGKGERGQAILHLERAFHGRSGYTLSVTNTDPVKTRYFPKFSWPRIPCPSLGFPLTEASMARTQQAEAESIAIARRAFERDPDDIAAILVEPIQGEGGDNHFRADFLAGLRALADEFGALLIFDEVQTGVGLTGKWWAYEHFGVEPDILCFAKKMQVGGIFVSRRIDDLDTNVFRVPSRINSTWGGSLVDMVRATRILEVIEETGLLENARVRGEELRQGLVAIEQEFEGVVSNARGRGLMCACDLPSKDLRDALVKRTFDEGAIVLASGERSLRFRPSLSVSAEGIAEGLSALRRALTKLLRAKSSGSAR